MLSARPSRSSAKPHLMVDDIRIAAALAVLGAHHRHRRQERDADCALTVKASRQHDRLTGDVDQFVFDSMLYSSVSFRNFAMERRPCWSMTDEAGGPRCPAESPMDPNVARPAGGEERKRQTSTPSAAVGIDGRHGCPPRAGAAHTAPEREGCVQEAFWQLRTTDR